ACDISIQKEGSGPAIQGEQLSLCRSYGDLFTYEKSRRGKGLAVTGFRGDKNKTIIFQNRSGNTPVVEIADDSFSSSPTEEAILTEGISYIGRKAFSGCNKLHQVVLPISIEEIGDFSFENCNSLKSVSLPTALKTIGDGAFKGTGLRTIAIPKSVFWVGEGLLAECDSLDHLTISENIERIPAKMFENCKNLKKVELQENLVEIGERAFFGCSSLDFLIIPDSVKQIGLNAFANMDKQFILQCSFGSYAEEYARKNKIKYQLV
ncbi:MAG: leucine-rich repeat domain-containing protein, partial [Anaerobutyricum sp.]